MVFLLFLSFFIFVINFVITDSYRGLSTVCNLVSRFFEFLFVRPIYGFINLDPYSISLKSFSFFFYNFLWSPPLFVWNRYTPLYLLVSIINVGRRGAFGTFVLSPYCINVTTLLFLGWFNLKT